MRSRLKAVFTVLILLATIGAGVGYFVTHQAVRHQLGQTSLPVIIIVLILYLASMAALAGITIATLRLCHNDLPPGESLLVTAYTAIINFFGPLQSGPAFRAVYLKTRHGVKLKNYAAATLVYYFFYGGFSVLLLISSLLKWWLPGLAALGLAAGWYVKRQPQIARRLRGVDLRGWYYLAAATLLQVLIVLLIYDIELRTVAPGTHFWQAAVYTGAANLAMFVSITPGAIGFRESFLVFSRHLHHVNNASIVAASILDRALYIILLLLLAVAIFGSHAHNRLRAKKH